MRDDDEDKPFEVKDRRRFDASGDSAPGENESESGGGSSDEAAPDAGKDGLESGENGPSPGVADAELPPVEFSTLLLSLASSVVLHLGEMPRPDTGKTERNLPLAKQTIDLLGLLQQKTRGNLSKDESDLLESLLYELRLKYVQAVG